MFLFSGNIPTDSNDFQMKNFIGLDTEFLNHLF